MRLRAAIMVGALLLVPLSAQADTRGWYIGGGGGWSDVEDLKSGAARVALKNGFGVLGFAGYDFGALRLEGELDYREAYARLVTTVAGIGGAPGGTLKSGALMLNAIYNIFPSSRFTPYLGLCAGGARLSADNLSASSAVVANGTQTKAAYQGITGIRYALSPKVALALDYRYFATLDPTFAGAGGTSFKAQYHTHNALLSVIFHFGPPSPSQIPSPSPPPPPPAPAPIAAPAVVPPPAPAAPRLFLVFFDFDRATLTPATRSLRRPQRCSNPAVRRASTLPATQILPAACSTISDCRSSARIACSIS